MKIGLENNTKRILYIVIRVDIYIVIIKEIRDKIVKEFVVNSREGYK